MTDAMVSFIGDVAVAHTQYQTDHGVNPNVLLVNRATLQCFGGEWDQVLGCHVIGRDEPGFYLNRVEMPILEEVVRFFNSPDFSDFTRNMFDIVTKGLGVPRAILEGPILRHTTT